MAAWDKSASAPGWHFPRSRRHFYYSPQKLRELEKNFILDGVPLSKLANDETDRTNPTINLGIPQYYGKKDPHCHLHYSHKNLSGHERNGKDLEDSSMMGLVYDKFISSSAANQYIEGRKKLGAGYTRTIYGGHTTVPIAVLKPGYHGENGYRRNTPSLRYKPSPFDLEDSFEASKPYYLKLQKEVIAKGNICHYRAKSAKLYRQPPMQVIKNLTSSSSNSVIISEGIKR